jgi:hypothetical protein
MLPSTNAEITATTIGCFEYGGTFDELQVNGECNRTMGTTKFHAFLKVDRNTGAFKHIFALSDVGAAGNTAESVTEYSGHCVLGKK